MLLSYLSAAHGGQGEAGAGAGPSLKGYAIYQGMMAGLACFAESAHSLRRQLTEMTRQYFEPLEQRRLHEAYTRFCGDMLFIGAYNDDFEQILV